VAVVAEILLEQVMSLRITDQASNENLAVAGENLDKVKFVRN
jgi:hypothetical protein